MLTERTPQSHFSGEGDATSGTTLPPPEQNVFTPLDFEYDGDYLTCLTAPSILGVDVSSYQRDVDWEKVKDAGYEFAFFRLGYRGYQLGGLHVDNTFYQNMENAGKAGLDLGVYFFSQAISEEEAIEEAYFVLNELKNYEVQLPVVYDPEFVYADDSRTKDLASEQIMKNIKAFCDVIDNAGYETMLYASMYWEAEILDMSVTNKKIFGKTIGSLSPNDDYIIVREKQLNIIRKILRLCGKTFTNRYKNANAMQKEDRIKIDIMNEI